MTLKRLALRTCSRFVPDRYHPPGNILLPFGHIVADHAPLHVKHLYKVPTVAKFRQDLDFLCGRYRPVQIPELDRLPSRRFAKPAGREFVLSFDDGMREVYEIIAPILRAKGIPAVFFLNSSTIDNKQIMWRHKVSLVIDRIRQGAGRVPPQVRLRQGETIEHKLRAIHFGDQAVLDDIAKSFGIDFDDYLRRARPYLTTDQVLELSRAGFEFGAHSDTHPYFNRLPVEDQRSQISKSVAFIRDLAIPCRCFAFPFHDHGAATALFGYMKDLDLVLSFGTSEARSDSVPFSFQRFAVDAENADRGMRYILKDLSLKMFVRRLSGTELIQRN